MKQSSSLQIDWETVRNRVAAACLPIARQQDPPDDVRRKILQQRSRELARVAQPDAVEETLSLVEFDLAGERYAVELTGVREVSLLKELTPVPCTPPFIVGVMNLRGEIRTVIDLKKFFELPSRGITELNKIIMLHAAGREVGILADSIVGVRSVPVSGLQPSLPTLTGLRADYLRGVTADRLVVLDVAGLLASERIIISEEESTTPCL